MLEKRQHGANSMRGDQADSILSQSADLQVRRDLSSMKPVIKVDPCAFSPASTIGLGGASVNGSQLHTPRSLSRASSSHGEQVAPESNEVNLYALFPGWQSHEHKSLKEFIVDWLIGFFKVPLTSDGRQWIKELEMPVLDVKCGCVIAKCTGISAGQQAIIKGKCTMSLLPWRAQGEAQEDGAADVGGSDEDWDKLLDQHGIMQIMCAYYESSPNGGPGLRTASTEQETIVEEVNSSGVSGVGKYQAILRSDGMVFIDVKHLQRTTAAATNAILQTLCDNEVESADGAVIKLMKRIENELIVQIAGGRNHFLCLTSEGRIYAFGTSMQGQMGFLATSPAAVWHCISINATSKASMLPLGAKVVQVACGADHSLAVVDNGLVYGFGNNANGQVGLPDGVEIHEPTVLLKFERMSSAALLNAKGVYVRTDFDVVSTDIPWVVAAACGDGHSVFLTASGQIFACGDNSSGQIGYSGGALCYDQDDVFESLMEDRLYDGGAGGELAVTDASIGASEILQFQVPILLEGGHVPTTASMVACGSRHTSVVSHNGRVYIYGGVPKRATDPTSKSKYSGNLVWRTEHNPSLHLDADAYASSLVYHGDPEKIVHIACCGDLTLVSYFKTSEASGHNTPSNLDKSVFWWGPDVTPSLMQLQYQIPKSPPPGFRRDTAVSHGWTRGVAFSNSRLKTSDAFMRSNTPGSPGPDVDQDVLVNPEKMEDLISLLRMMNRLYMACRSMYPAVREEAVTLWGSQERLLIEAERKHSFMKARPDFGEILDGISRHYNLTLGEKRQIVMGSQLVLYRTTQKRQVMADDDVNFLFSIGVESMWRPHLLHDRLWNGPSDTLTQGSLANTKLDLSLHPGPFVLLAEDILDVKLEAASIKTEYKDQRSIVEAVRELAPRVDLAMLFLCRRGNTSSDNTSTVIGQLLSKEYYVEVKTGAGPNTATDSHIFIEIVGTNGTSGERSLVYSDNANAFESGQTDIFSLSCTELGHIKKIVLRNEGAAVKSIWKLDEIRVWQAGNEKLVYDFPFYGWMDPRIPGIHMHMPHAHAHAHARAHVRAHAHVRMCVRRSISLLLLSLPPPQPHPPAPLPLSQTESHRQRPAVCVYVYACVCVCIMYIYTYTHTHTHTHTHTCISHRGFHAAGTLV